MNNCAQGYYELVSWHVIYASLMSLANLEVSEYEKNLAPGYSRSSTVVALPMSRFTEINL